jgi:pyridoxal phosphate enzyme (YggS family)
VAFDSLADNLARVREEIARVQAAEGVRDPLTLIAVTKGHGPDAVRAAADAGLTDVGENRVQEALGKIEASGGARVQWHLIGHLQTNKARLAAGRFALVQSVDSWRVAEALAQAAEKNRSAPQRVLLQVNVAGESQKSGCAPGEAADLAHRIATEGRLRLEGLMTMAPFTDDVAVQRRAFGDLRRLKERISAAGLPLTQLSMGMSGDYRSAVAEGATMLRLGTILFGERQ